MDLSDYKKLPLLLIGGRFVPEVIELIHRAQETIDIIVFDWRLPVGDQYSPVDDLILALLRAKDRGVAVRILVANEAIGARLKLKGFEVRQVYTKKLMHCKVMLLDRVVAVVGSHNYTLSAFTLNMEVSVAVRLPEEPNELSLFFQQLWGW